MPDLQDIHREQSDSKGRYYWSAPGEPEAELTYSVMSATTHIIDHTGVPDAYAGQNVGRDLWLRAVTDARAEGVKIVPLCPFAAAMFRRYPEWQDVLSR
ncbi:MAG: GNAT family N-acetyltransferase [Pseudomonadota bacterium]